ncbi:MAG: hypothetical protein CMG00_01660 [Candidatus Marinimicrobia bacterium]|nr:hypothetical protein [Candidatus Neomarinimicrobiota bacterium]
MLIIFIITVCFSICCSESWYFHKNNPWSVNQSSKSSAIGGFYLDYLELIKSSKNESSVQLYNSSMYGNIIDYNNFFYSFRIPDIVFFGNKFDLLRIGIMDRKIDDIPFTANAWDSYLFNEPILSSINYDLIDQFTQRDLSVQFLIPFRNKFGDFGINLNFSLFKLNNYTSDSINLDLIYAKTLNNYYLQCVIKNLASYRKWNTNEVERFYPYVLLSAKFDLYKTKIFFQVDELYINQDYLKSSKISDLYSFGFEHPINYSISFLGGVNHYFSSLGFDLKFSDFLFGYTYLSHLELNESHQFSITYFLQNK